jgi:hypothetical protein
MDALVERALAEVAAQTDEDRRRALMRESNPALGEYFRRHPADMEEVAFTLFDLAWSDMMVDDVTAQIIEVKTVGLGDVDWVDEDLRGMTAYFQGKGGQILSDMLRYQRTQMPREEMAVAIDLHRDEILLDFWGTFAKLEAQCNEKVRQLPVMRLISLIQTGIQAGTTFAQVPAATLTPNNIDPVLDFVAQRSKGQVTIIGARNAVRILGNIGVQFGPNVAERVFNAGQVGVYKGYPIVEVQNWEDFAGNLQVPVNELWVVGQNAGRLTYFGADAKVQQLPRSGFYIRWESARDVGLLLFGIGRGRLGRIVFT